MRGFRLGAISLLSTILEKCQIVRISGVSMQNQFSLLERIEIEDYAGEVFNLETENEEYIVSGVVVHNCPHYFDITTPKVSADDCANLWRPGIPPGRGHDHIHFEPVEPD